MKKMLLTAILGSAAHAADWRPAQLPQAEETTITSAHTGRSYRIQTSTIGAAPPEGYPVLYLLDGDNYFPYALPLARSTRPATAKNRRCCSSASATPADNCSTTTRAAATTPRR